MGSKNIYRYKKIYARILKGILQKDIATEFGTDPSFISVVKKYCEDNPDEFKDVIENPDLFILDPIIIKFGKRLEKVEEDVRDIKDLLNAILKFQSGK